MNSVVLESAMFGLLLTVLGYQFGMLLKEKYKSAVFNPLLISIIISILFSQVFRVEYDVYYDSAKYISYLLTPATVCLAIPLYQKIMLLRENFKAIMVGVFTGVLTSLGSVLGMSMLFQLSHEEYVTLLPKSITTAIGIGIVEEYGGITTIAVAAIIVTGLLGNILAESIRKVFRITDPIAKGVAIGTSAHTIGTAKAMEMGEFEGAMSSLAIVVSGLCTVIGASFFDKFMVIDRILDSFNLEIF